MTDSFSELYVEVFFSWLLAGRRDVSLYPQWKIGILLPMPATVLGISWCPSAYTGCNGVLCKKASLEGPRLMYTLTKIDKSI